MYVLAHYQSVLIALREVIERTCIWNQGQNFFMVCVISLVDAAPPTPIPTTTTTTTDAPSCCSFVFRLHAAAKLTFIICELMVYFPVNHRKEPPRCSQECEGWFQQRPSLARCCCRFCCGKMAEMGNLMREYVPRSDSPSLCPRLGFF